MKTPREILFEQHESAEPKLDAIRRRALADCAEPRVSPEPSRNAWPIFNGWLIPLKLWRELIWPCRRVWGGLAAVWFVLLLWNLNMEEAPATAAKRTSTITPEVLMALREQKQMLAQLLDQNAPAAAPPTPPALRGPRSELREMFLRA